MTRLVVDTNILISAFFWGGLPGKVLEGARRGDYILVSSEGLLAELLTVLEREKFAERLRIINRTPQAFLQNHRALVEVVDVTALPEQVSDDPDDDMVLACAVSSDADFIVSGDNDLLRLESYAGIPILKPSQFLERLKNDG